MPTPEEKEKAQEFDEDAHEQVWIVTCDHIEHGGVFLGQTKAQNARRAIEKVIKEIQATGAATEVKETCAAMGDEFNAYKVETSESKWREDLLL